MTSRFGPQQRLRNRAGFDAVYANRRSRRVGPLLVFVRVHLQTVPDLA